MDIRRAITVITAVAALLCQSAFGDDGPTPKQASISAATALTVSPQTVRLGGANRAQQLLITARDSSGRLFDVTHHAKIVVTDADVAKLDGSQVAGVANGRTELVVSFGKQALRVPVIVANFDTFPPVHFASDIVPIFSKLGCNSGGCHGKQGGQNGFHLSVFGFDPRADYNALVKEARGRRTFPADPDQSLLLAKATGRLPHGGGRRTTFESADYEILSNWINQGSPWGNDNAPKLAELRVEPTERVMATTADQQILATAIYTDGSHRDVTTAASYTGNADTVAAVDATGRVVTGRVPGEAAFTVNYMGQVAVVRLLVPRPNAPAPYPKLPTNNQVDVLVLAKLKQMGIVPSVLADDATFLRRLFVDSIGTLPKPHEVRKFLADRNPNKRKRAIERILNREEFADYWALRWADVLLVNRETLGERGAFEFHRWLRTQMANNRPYDQWVRELVTATGSSGRNGPVNFYRALPKPEDAAKAVSQAFLGVRLDCAQCHHHPYDKWDRKDFYGMVGFFNGLQRKPLGGNRELVYHAGYRETKMPLSGEVVPTRPPAGKVFDKLDRADPRVELARWITARKNPWFARLAANRIWAHFLGRGLIDPVDDLRFSSPATNEPLLAYLAAQVVENDYDLKAVMRIVLNSRVYQFSSRPNATNFDDEQNYSHYTVKRLSAEVLLDAVCQVTGVPETYPGMPRGTRAIGLWDNRLPSYFLDTFGRSERKSPCECGKSNEPTMSQALHLLNAPEIEAKITAADGRVGRLLKSAATRDRIVEEICLAALGRRPGKKEQQIAAKLFSKNVTQQQAAEDFLWTMLNSYDFLFVH